VRRNPRQIVLGPEGGHRYVEDWIASYFETLQQALQILEKGIEKLQSESAPPAYIDELVARHAELADSAERGGVSMEDIEQLEFDAPTLDEALADNYRTYFIDTVSDMSLPERQEGYRHEMASAWHWAVEPVWGPGLPGLDGFMTAPGELDELIEQGRRAYERRREIGRRSQLA